MHKIDGLNRVFSAEESGGDNDGQAADSEQVQMLMMAVVVCLISVNADTDSSFQQ